MNRMRGAIDRLLLSRGDRKVNRLVRRLCCCRGGGIGRSIACCNGCCCGIDRCGHSEQSWSLRWPIASVQRTTHIGLKRVTTTYVE
jgi:hypothetical protein